MGIIDIDPYDTSSIIGFEILSNEVEEVVGSDGVRECNVCNSQSLSFSHNLDTNTPTREPLGRSSIVTLWEDTPLSDFKNYVRLPVCCSRDNYYNSVAGHLE